MKSIFTLMKRLTSLSVLGWCITSGAQQDLYFPGEDASWQQISPASAGWDQGKLDAALDLAGELNSSAVVVLYKGQIMAERYWEMENPARAYLNFVTGKDQSGRVIEDVASAQKSVVAVLTGIAAERGFVAITDPVSNFLPAGWSKASAEQEQAITLRHLLTMTSGLNDELEYQAEPGAQWRYNTPAYHLIMKALMAATDKDRNELTSEWITRPLEMSNSSWTKRTGVSAAIADGFSTSARELARFGIMIQAGGRWKDQPVTRDQNYLQAMLSPSQDLNPAYGYLWWLNGEPYLRPGDSDTAVATGKLIPAAPDDLVAMQGARDKKLYLVPSLDLIITRLGDSGSSEGVQFGQVFWQALMEAAPVK